MKLVLATNNKDKVKEMKAILASRFDEILTLDDLKINHETIEDGKDFYENSYKKAKEICDICHMPTLADDSGLCIDALDGAPGLYSARFAGVEHNYLKNNEKVLELLKGETNRKAHFTTIVTVCFPDGRKVVAKGEAHGHIVDEYSGDKGFGYDPIFYSDELKMTFAKAGEDAKNHVSHRYHALMNLLKELEKFEEDNSNK